MSIHYCEKHDRHVDLDWESDCLECENEVIDREEEISSKNLNKEEE